MIRKRWIAWLLCLTLVTAVGCLFASCVGTLVEIPDENAAVFPDAAVGSLEEAKNYLDDLAILPQGVELLDGKVQNNEIILDLKADPSVRLAYEGELQHFWYTYLDPTPETGDLLCAYLHPTGWRVALYDNRRNRELQETYGDGAYVFRVCIKDLSYDPALFPKYPSDDKDLFVEPQLLFTSKEYPAEVLPENFPGMPENAILTTAGMSQSGVWFSFLTDQASYAKWMESANGYGPDGDAYADGDGNYFRITEFALLRVVEFLDEREYELYMETSEEMRKEWEKQGIDPEQFADAPKMYYSLDELPKVDGDPRGAVYLRITVHAVRDEWLPEWWKERRT